MSVPSIVKWRWRGPGDGNTDRGGYIDLRRPVVEAAAWREGGSSSWLPSAAGRSTAAAVSRIFTIFKDVDFFCVFLYIIFLGFSFFYIFFGFS